MNNQQLIEYLEKCKRMAEDTILSISDNLLSRDELQSNIRKIERNARLALRQTEKKGENR